MKCSLISRILTKRWAQLSPATVIFSLSLPSSSSSASLGRWPACPHPVWKAASSCTVPHHILAHRHSVFWGDSLAGCTAGDHKAPGLPLPMLACAAWWHPSTLWGPGQSPLPIAVMICGFKASFYHQQCYELEIDDCKCWSLSLV